jgi:hypothetical protein
LTPPNSGKAALDHRVAAAHLERHGNRRQRVLDVVPPGHRHLDASIRRVAPSRLRTTASKRLPPERRHRIAAHVGLGREPVVTDAPVADAGMIP